MIFCFLLTGKLFVLNILEQCFQPVGRDTLTELDGRLGGMSDRDTSIQFDHTKNMFRLILFSVLWNISLKRVKALDKDTTNISIMFLYNFIS